jgi:hypothetical protein
MRSSSEPIWSGLAFLVAAAGGILASQQCVPCLALPIGAAAGYLSARRFAADGPSAAGPATSAGARAGAIAGVGAFAGHLVGGVASAVLRGVEGASGLLDNILSNLGITLPPVPPDPTTYYITVIAISLFLGIFEIALMAGAGALAARVGQARATARPR